MTQYIVHIYREMRLTFADIEADTPEGAATLARSKPTDDAATIDDCEGQNLAALVDVAGDEDYSQSVVIDFEAERVRKATHVLLAALVAIMPYAESEAESLHECSKRDGDLQIKDAADACERAIESARAAVALAKAACPPRVEREPDLDDLHAKRREIAITWSIEDVKGIRPDLNEDQCWEVLKNVQREHDAEYGINWSTLEEWAQELFDHAPESSVTEEA